MGVRMIMGGGGSMSAMGGMSAMGSNNGISAMSNRASGGSMVNGARMNGGGGNDPFAFVNSNFR